MKTDTGTLTSMSEQKSTLNVGVVVFLFCSVVPGQNA